MLNIFRTASRARRAFANGIYSNLSQTTSGKNISGYIFGQSSIDEKQIPSTGNQDIVHIQGVHGKLVEISLPDARRVMSIASEYQCDGTRTQGWQNTHNYSTNFFGSSSSSPEDVLSCYSENLDNHVSLNCYIESSVPNPAVWNENVTGYSSPLSMPDSGKHLLDKYISGSIVSLHPSRQFTTSSHVRKQSSQEYHINKEEILTDPSPQGIQGDNCVSFKLWMENCQRYNLPNCDEQLAAIKAGSKTLAEVFQEQQEIIQLVSEDYKKKQKNYNTKKDTSSQGTQDKSTYNFEFSASDPCPQGFQGDDCATFKIWAHNCKAFGFGDCEDKMKDMQSGRRTLKDIFDEQDESIRKIISNYKPIHNTSANPEVSKLSGSESMPPPHYTPPNMVNNDNVKQIDKLKRAIKEYGATVMIFHVSISLVSLGGFYLAVSSGLDVVGILKKIGIGETILQSRIAAGSTTFIIAYAVHKVFAPARIACTLICAPIIVRYLRRIGFLKSPK